MSLRALGAVLLGMLLLLLEAWDAEARPGGGQGYRGGGGSSGGSSGGDGGGELIFFLIRLVFAYPAVGVPVCVIAIGWYVMQSRSAPQENWDATATPMMMVNEDEDEAADLGELRERDPEFSTVLFEDFAYGIFARAHQGRSSAEALERLAPYLSAPVRQRLAAREPVGAPVTGAVIGAMTVQRVSPAADGASRAEVVLGFEANVAIDRQGGALTEYVVESWTLTRSGSAVTRAWKGARTFGCPGCGAPFEAAGQDQCASCGQVVSDGRFDWIVEDIAVSSSHWLPPTLRGTVEERGTDLPTVREDDVDEVFAELQAADPAITRSAFDARIRVIFTELNAAWSTLALERARPYVSDGLFAYLRYWTEAYRAQGLRNVVDNATVEHIELARVVRDKHYDAVTVRVFGSGRDYTLEQASGRVVGGSKQNNRPYTEYWTLVRAAGVRGAPRVDRKCPNCAGPLEVGMTGNCNFCGSLVTTGEFDWVLGRIQQDDAYA